METQNKETESAVGYIKGRMQNMLLEVEQLTKKIIETREEKKSLRESIISKKMNDSNLKASDVKEILVNIQQLHYTETLLDADIKRIVTILGENYTTLKAVKQVDDISEEAKEILENYTNAARSIFVIEDGVPKIAEEAIQKMIESKIESARDNTEQLESFFNSPNFQPTVE